MRKLSSFALAVVLTAAVCLLGQTKKDDKYWPNASPESVGVDPAPIKSLDADFAADKYPDVDSLLVIRCNKDIYQRKYHRDYGKIYYKQAHERGPLNARLTGIYNYFDPQYHPYYKGTDGHTMQSVTKTVNSVLTGIAMTRDEYHATLDTPILKFFDVSKVKNLDDRKRRITIRDLLTMRSGIDWDEDLPYNNPHNGSSAMEATDDWVQFVIDRPMAYDPGTHFAYTSGGAELVGYVFQKATGKDIIEYANEHLFRPLGFEQQYWKRTPLGLADTEGGLYLRPEDLAKIGRLYMQNGVWNGQRIVSSEWVKQSIAPSTDARGGMKYGFEWWLVPHGPAPERLAWAALGFGGQRLLVVPEDDLMVVLTGWDLLGNATNAREMLARIMPAVHAHSCSE